MSNANTAADDFDHNAITEDELAFELAMGEPVPCALTAEEVEAAAWAFEMSREP